jgi:hypothetical protein
MHAEPMFTPLILDNGQPYQDTDMLLVTRTAALCRGCVCHVATRFCVALTWFPAALCLFPLSGQARQPPCHAAMSALRDPCISARLPSACGHDQSSFPVIHNVVIYNPRLPPIITTTSPPPFAVIMHDNISSVSATDRQTPDQISVMRPKLSDPSTVLRGQKPVLFLPQSPYRASACLTCASR